MVIKKLSQVVAIFLFGAVLLPEYSKAQASLGMNSVLWPAGDSMYFWANDSANHLKLFTIDPGSDSVRQVSDLIPGGHDSVVRPIKVIGTKVYFIAKNTNGYEKLFYTEAGSTGAPTQVTDTGGANASDNIRFHTNSSTMAYFTGYTADGVSRLYSLDLANNSVAQVSLGCVDAFSTPCDDSPEYVTLAGTNVYFMAYDDTGNYKVYLKKPGVGAAALTGPSGPLNFQDSMVAVGSKVYFSGYYTVNGGSTIKVFSDDGTTTTQASDTNPIASDDPTNLTVIDSDLYYSGRDNLGNTRLYKISGGAAPVLQTTVNAASSDDPNYINRVGTDLYFVANTTAGGVAKLFKLTSAGVRTQITNTAGNGVTDQPVISFVEQSRIFLVSNDPIGYFKGYVYNTQSGSLTKILDRGDGLASYPSKNLSDGNKIYFMDSISKRTSGGAYEYNASNDSLTKLSRFSGTMSQTADVFQVDSGRLYYTGGTKNYSEDLGGGAIGMWSSTTLGALINSISGSLSSIAPGLTGIYVSGDPTLTSSSSVYKLLFYDFSTSAFNQVSNLTGTGSTDGTDSEILVTSSGGVYFAVNDGTQRDYYFTDGTSFTHIDISVGSDDGIMNASIVGNSMYFYAHNGIGQYNLYKVTGAAAPVLFAAPQNSFDGSRPYVASSTIVYFQGEDGSGNTKIFSANPDGTGISKVVDINVGASDSFPAMALLGDDLYFVESSLGLNTLYKYVAGTGITSAVDSTGYVQNNLKAIGSDLYFSNYQGSYFYLDKINATGTRTSISGNHSNDITSFNMVNGNLYFVGRNAADTKAALYQYTAAGALSEVQMPDSDTTVINGPMKSSDGYLYFMAKSSTGVREYFRLLAP